MLNTQTLIHKFQVFRDFASKAHQLKFDSNLFELLNIHINKNGFYKAQEEEAMGRKQARAEEKLKKKTLNKLDKLHKKTRPRRQLAGN